MADVAQTENHRARDRSATEGMERGTGGTVVETASPAAATAFDLERVRNTLDARITQEANRLDGSIAGLREEMVRLDAKIDRVAAEIRAEIAGVRTEIAGLDGKIAGLDGKIAGLDAKIDRVAAGLDGKIDRVAAELDGKIDRVAAELDGKIAGLDAKIDRVAAEIRTEIAALANTVTVRLGVWMTVLAGIIAAVQYLG